MQGFQLDQIPARSRLKFLSLVGVSPAPPRPATVVLRFGLPPGAEPLELPATVECEGSDLSGGVVPYRTLAPIQVVPARLEAIASTTPAGTRDLTDRWRRGEPFAPFGEDPEPGAALILSLSASLSPGVPVTVFVSSADDGADRASRALIESAEELARRRCRTPPSLVACDVDIDADAEAPPAARLLAHQSARTVWELEVAPGRWRRLDADAGEVVDDTRALTLNGTVEIVAPEPMYAHAGAGGETFSLRCRLARGRYEAPPILRDVAVNGVEAEQSVPASEAWPIAPDVTLVDAPRPGRMAQLGLELDAADRICRLDPADPSAPPALVLGYEEPAGEKPGALTVEAVLLGRSDGSPEQAVTLPGAPVDADSVRVWTLDQSSSQPSSRVWRLQRDLDASGPADADAVLDAERGTIQLGDGERGLVPPTHAAIVAAYRTTEARNGNLHAGAIHTVSAGLHNRALLTDAARGSLDVTNPVPATGGAGAETLEHAEGRASELASRVTRAVTSADFEQLALATPGTRLARAIARANVHPGLPCVEAVGIVTVVVLPFLPAARPEPTLGLLRAVSAHLNAHRIVGTRVEVTGPTYTVVSVQARVSATRLAIRSELVQRIGERLDRFFHPLHGGPDGTGWPLGRDVVRSEVLQVIDAVPGVDHVLDLELVDEDGASCGNLCLGPAGLVVSGVHRIEVSAE